MAKLTVSDAARVTGVSRMLLYRYIKAGKLSRTSERRLRPARQGMANIETTAASDVAVRPGKRAVRARSSSIRHQYFLSWEALSKGA
jgi:excisionase family DNA binding protein